MDNLNVSERVTEINNVLGQLQGIISEVIDNVDRVKSKISPILSNNVPMKDVGSTKSIKEEFSSPLAQTINKSVHNLTDLYEQLLDLNLRIEL